MRHQFMFACALLLLATLAACDGGATQTVPTLIATNTPASPQPTITLPPDLGPTEGTVRPTDVAPIDNPTATIDPTLAATIEAINQAAATSGAIAGAPSIEPPSVGTIEQAPATEDPDAGLTFDELYFSQTGGIAGTSLMIYIYPDGRVLRDDVEYRITLEEVAAIDNTLDELNFFGMQGTFTSAGGGRDTYIYELSVARGENTRTVIAEDGLIPPELMELFSVLLEAGLTRPGS